MVLKQVVNTRAEMPVLGFEDLADLILSELVPGERLQERSEAVKIALEAGYRHIDTAIACENEKEVGEGIRLSGIPREEIFLTTKLNPTNMRDPKAALEYSPKHLDTPYLDLWLLHWPTPLTKDEQPDRDLDRLDVYKGVEKIYKENLNKIKAIEVSNWSVSYLERLLKHATVIPVINQIELHPSCTQTELVEFSKSKGIAITVYSSLGSTGTPLARNDVVNKIAEKKGISVLCKSVTTERIRCERSPRPLGGKGLVRWLITPHNVADTELIDLRNEEIEELLAIDETSHFRCCHPDWTGYGSLGFPDCEQIPWWKLWLRCVLTRKCEF